jgi:hypothetical protein
LSAPDILREIPASQDECRRRLNELSANTLASSPDLARAIQVWRAAAVLTFENARDSLDTMAALLRADAGDAALERAASALDIHLRAMFEIYPAFCDVRKCEGSA